MDFGIVSFAAIVVLVYLVGSAVKVSNLNNDWIPVICGASGLLLGILAFYLKVPDFPATDPMTAAAVGVVSGFAATGINQAIKRTGTKK